MGSKIAVKVENRTFNSLKDACEFLKIQNVAGLAQALSKGNSTYKGLAIEKVIKKTPGNKSNHERQSCPVICETQGIKFKSIAKAAKYAQADGWTMSKKMETAGQFIDKNGNVYKRMKPMQTKNTYSNTGAEVKRIIEFHERPNARKQEVAQPVVKEEPVETKIESPVIEESKINGIDIAKNILKEKAMNFVIKDQFTLAKELMDVIEKL